jgi:hypothetical protein
VLSDGPIVVPLDDGLKRSLLTDPRAVYQVRAIAECFSVKPSPIQMEWRFTLRESPSQAARAIDAVVTRLTADYRLQFCLQVHFRGRCGSTFRAARALP